jgi:cytochrome c nitrite reductase small subunit
MKLLLIVLSISLGCLGVYTFIYAEGFSYFSTDPKACINCHVMKPQYDAWSKSGHHHVATCNDCHLPQSGIQKYIAKARNGFHHSLAFTLENFHEPIQMSSYNQEKLIENCKRCHENLVQHVQTESCLHCHRNLGHYPIH